MSSIPRPNGDRAALYMRVSSERQADRGTIEAQADFLKSFSRLYGLDIAGEYADDGWSGTLPLADRPAGRRLLEDARAGLFGAVIVYRLDRLGRSLTSLIEAHDALERAGVAIKSASEPFDTQQPIGKFLFQLLGSLAELDRSNMQERLILGRDRVAKAGKWTGGPVPFGYDLDAEGCLVASDRSVHGSGQTESELARTIFERIAAGFTIPQECRRLDALGVGTEQRYAGGTVKTVARTWGTSRLSAMLKRPTYYGRHVLRSKNGPIERKVPAIVDRQLWDAVQAALARNRRLSSRNAKHRYLLRGLITCAHCGLRFTGSYSKQGNGTIKREYRCAGQLSSVRLNPAERCRSKLLPADWLEEVVWGDCRRFIEDPGAALQEAQAELRRRMGATAESEAEQHRLVRQLAGHEAERERVMTLFRRGRATLEEVERQLDAIQSDAADVRARLDVLRAQQEITAAYEAHYAEAVSMLARLREGLRDIEKTNDWETRRKVIELLVTEIRAETEGSGRHKTSRIRIAYAFTPARTVDVVASATPFPGDSRALVGTGRDLAPRSAP
jgi:site-specific DNA recombinase